MKRIFTLIILASGCMLNAMAQSTGFYHVKNTYTDRYMIMTDNQKGNTTGTTKIDMKAISTSKDWDKVSTHPGAICYLESKGGTKYDVKAQNTSLHAFTGLYADIVKTSDGYTLSGSYSGVRIYLGDKAETGKTDSWLVEAGEKNKYWELYQIDNNDHYIGIKPDVKDDNGDYWGSTYTGFAFKLQSSGMKAYYVKEANGENFQLEEFTGSVIPSYMPVIIKCSSSDPAKNIIKPVTDSASEPSYGTYHLNARFYDCSIQYHNNFLTYDSNTMRVIGLSGGKLAFVKASSSDLTEGKYVPHNKAYLDVPSGASSTITQGTVGIRNITAENQQINEGTYNLAGQKIPEGETLRPGVYIQNGKKIVVQ